MTLNGVQKLSILALSGAIAVVLAIRLAATRPAD
jgi:hypothetical protein